MEHLDPVTIALTVALTAAARRFSSGKLERALVRLTPLAAVCIAVGVRAALDAAQGAPLSLETVQHAVQAGANAVFAHAAYRSLVKQIPAAIDDGPES